MNEHSDLNRRLADAANSEEFTVPDLRPAARSARRRRSALITGGAALTAAALTGTAFVVLQNQATQVALPPASPTASAPAAPASHSPASPSAVESDVLDHATIAARCAPQMAKFNALYPDADGEWAVLHPHEYREGDVVRLGVSLQLRGDQADGMWVAEGLCIIPSEADVSTPVPMSALLPDPADDAALLASCSESLRTSERGAPGSSFDTPDLRSEGRVVAVDTAGKDGDYFGNVIYVQAETDAESVTCLLSATDATGTPSITSYGEAPLSIQTDADGRPMANFNSAQFGKGGKDGDGTPQTYLYGTGVLPREATEIFFPDANVSVPVKDGRFHAVEVIDGHPTVDYYWVRNAQGDILGQGPWGAAPEDPASMLEACQSRVTASLAHFGDELKGIDLTTGTIEGVGKADGLARVLIQHADTQFVCDLGLGQGGLEWSSAKIDPTLDATDWDKEPGYGVWLTATINNDGSALYQGHGSLPADATSIQFSGDLSATVELTAGEPWVFVKHVQGNAGEGKVAYTVLGANGTVLAEGQATGF